MIINKDEFSALAKSGASVKELQTIFGISRSTVYKRKKDWNLLGLGPSSSRKADIGKKICKTCNLEKDLQDFHSNGYTPLGLQKHKAECKLCASISRNRNHYNLIRKILEENNTPIACELCGYNKNWAALTFHHLDPAEKEYEIGNMKTFSEAKVREEVNKCVLLCHNCHMEEHYPHLEIVIDDE